jgi:tetraacyldisaccharide 4'-kinase
VIVREILAALSWLYAAGVAVRNAAFSVGILRVVRAGVPVISVGNITVGGAGKTPMVEYLIGYCIARGSKVAVVSRGYGRMTRGVRVISDGVVLRADASIGGDEPVQMASRFPAAVIVVAESRVDAALIAVKDFGATLVLMDDGFQHRYLHRDLDLVVVDGGRDVRCEPLLPLGRRREPLRAFRRAGFVMFSRVKDGAMARAAGLAIAPWYKGPTAGMAYTADELCAMDGTVIDPEVLRRGTGFAFCGIADPEGFLTTLRDTGIRIAGHAWFPDHHRFSPQDVDLVNSKAAALGSSFLITTEKDATRLRATLEGKSAGSFRLPVHYLRISVSIMEGEGMFHSAIDHCLGRVANA